MKTIVQINTVPFGSTGNIMNNISSLGSSEFKMYKAYRKINNSNSHDILIGNKFTRYINAKLEELTSLHGSFCFFSTLELIKKLHKIDPDIIHLHNIHGSYLNFTLLFNYLKKSNKQVIWTLHDCWSFTGKCPYYTIANCKKWKTQCFKCPQINLYPKMRFFDNTKYMFNKKKCLFTGLTKLHIVTVSNWLKDQVKQSFLADYEITVIENGIETDIFKPTQSEIRSKFKLENKFIILGVANPWSKRKGLDDFIELSKTLDAEFQIVLIGLSNEQKNEIKRYNILGLNKTNNQEELAQWYTTADVFFNASIEETFGLTTVEAMACGAPVIAYNSTASPEILSGKNNFIVEPKDFIGVQNAISSILTNKRATYSKTNIAKVNERYDCKKQYQKYIELYKKILGNK